MGSLTHKEDSQIQEAWIRLQRRNTTVKSLFKKLNSYTCEPHDSSCFEKFYNLKQSFRRFATHQNHIETLLKEKNTNPKLLEAEMKKQMARFLQLETDIASYLLSTNKHF